MDIFSNFATGVWSYGIMFLLVLTLVVFIHELGHFLVARWNGVAVKAFSIGFGPEIFGFNDRHGTRWRFAWIPLGGYVKFIDDENAASASAPQNASRLPPEQRDGAFHSKSVGQRAAVVAAGPIANFLLAIAIYAILNMSVGVRILPAYIDAVLPDSPAAEAGFLAGDKVVAIDGKAIEKFDDLQRIVIFSAGQELAFTVDRGGETLVLKVTPYTDEQPDPFGRAMRRGMIGVQRAVSPDKIQTLSVGPVEAIWRGVDETYTNIASTVAGLRDIITGKQSAEQMGGPILMAEVTGEIVKNAGFESILRWVALLSANIGFLNLLPIPVLDGGHLLFYGYEAARGKPMSERIQQMGFQVGLAVLVTLMIFVNFNDLANFIRRFAGAG
jgi:regulator of sigma E protease